jgi:hypothetical protein
MDTHNGGTITGSIKITDIKSLPAKPNNPRALPAGIPIMTEMMAVTKATSMLWINADIICKPAVPNTYPQARRPHWLGHKSG